MKNFGDYNGNCNARVTRSCNPRVTRSPGHVIYRSLYLRSVAERLSLRALLHWSVHELYTSTWHGAFSVISNSRDTPQRCKEFMQVVTKPIIDKKRYFYLRRDNKIRRAMEFDLKTYCSIQSNGGGLLWQITESMVGATQFWSRRKCKHSQNVFHGYYDIKCLALSLER